MGFKIERIPAPLWTRPLIPIAAILLTFLLTATLILLVKANPLEAYYYFLIDPLSSRVSAIEVLVKATPLLLTGAAVTFAFVGGYWNIGVEGQLYAGATAATAIGVQMQNVSPWLAIPLMLAGGFVAGMLWALVPALMKVKLAIDEVVTTLLLNSVALFMVSALLNGPWRNPISQWPQSPDIAATAIFPKLIPRSRLHLGFILALVIIVILWFVLTKTAFGLKMRAVGLSPHAAQFAGINVQRTMLISALVSGGIGGVAGVSEVAGIHYHLIDAISPGYGYTGIIIATLGTLNAWGVALAALFIGLIDTGAQTVSRALGVPTYLGDVIQAALLLVTLGMLLLQRYRITRTRSKP
ncbi:MAG: ABC transporter permease [Anaerolineaceae bacterium]|nr:ABC transporter permease [Anaerolineaceae bacterium]MCB9098197.1 ABC transporter permease [Anaerolineales bacterium]